MKRRDLINLAGLALAGGVLGLPSTALASGNGQRVIIIGAGISGLAAAFRLNELGYNVTILESRNRLGGRIWTDDRWPKTPVDLGASWIHGVIGNPITAIAKAAGARTVTTRSDRYIIYGKDGKIITPKQESRIEELSVMINRSIRISQNANRDRSILETVRSAVKWDQLSGEDRSWVDHIINSNIEQEYAGSAADTSTLWFDSDLAFQGKDVLLSDGFRTLTKHLANGLDIRTGTTVTEVAWNPSGVSVTTDHGVIQADKVVITLPLGVLKANKVRFDPGLPATKQKAIQALGMGLLNKCFLRFPRVFWPADRDWLESIGPVPGLWGEWMSYARSLGKPILVGFNAADVGRKVETWSDRKTVDSAMETLRRIYGNSIPDPVGYQITRWAADPFSLGSYSFNALGSRPTMRDDLAQSIDNRVFFAGEATDRKYFGTVHGAYLSGLRVAGEIGTTA